MAGWSGAGRAAGLSEDQVRSLIDARTESYDALPTSEQVSQAIAESTEALTTLEQVRTEISERAPKARAAAYTNAQGLILEPYYNVEIPLKVEHDPSEIMQNNGFRNPNRASAPGAEVPPALLLFTLRCAPGQNVADTLLRLSVAITRPGNEPETFYLDSARVSGRTLTGLQGHFSLGLFETLTVRIRSDYERFLIYNERLYLSVVIL